MTLAATSPAHSPTRARAHWWALTGLLVLGGALRLDAMRQDLFADELATYWIVSTRTASDVVSTVASTAEITPPLSFLLSWLTTRPGLSPELVRLPALLAGIASIPLVYAVGVRTVGSRAALLAATLTALSPFMIYYSAEARGYGVLMALLLLSTLALLLALEHDRLRWWALFALCTCLAAYTHYTAVFVLAGQVVWAAWVHRRARRSLLMAVGAAVVLYLPWLPSLKGDLDSPTTAILDFLSPLTAASARSTLGEWTVGFPVTLDEARLPFVLSVSSSRELPPTAGWLLLAASLAVGTYGLWSMRSRLRSWFAEHGGHLGLVVLLAVVTPLGALLQSALGDNVFRARSLAASWPYLALTIAALVTVGRPVVRAVAAGAAVAAFALSAIALLGDDFTRPGYEQVAVIVGDHPGAVVVDGAVLSPGPLTNLELEDEIEGTTILRLNVPDRRDRPFGLLDPRPDPAEVASHAVAEADGGPIVVVAFDPVTSIVDDFLEELPDDYALAGTEVVPGLVDLQAFVFERPDVET
ncbi:MAG: glycosyltransferase family 39 protein [Acidimicrobiales bacterium]